MLHIDTACDVFCFDVTEHQINFQEGDSWCALVGYQPLVEWRWKFQDVSAVGLAFSIREEAWCRHEVSNLTSDPGTLLIADIRKKMHVESKT